ncbi:MAG TPA: amino acid ABC transporter permease [Jatrophihabitans sp.]|jgi:glutamate transport system permease protein|uniref:amino acid ABC transporter permease n=1 Tax=Jatrophihabitans sp. TaxID=1932789 RepID=UPI002EE4F9E1
MTAPVLYDVQGPRARRRVLISSIVGGLALLVLLGLAAQRLAANEQFESDKYKPFFTEPQLYERLLEGLQNTLNAAVYAMVLASVLGVLLAFGRLSRQPWLRLPVIAVIEFFRGVPLLLLIFALFLAFPIVVNVDLPALWALVLALTMYNGAVIAEIIRAGVQSIPKGQTEAAYAIGLSRGQTLRMVLLPQAVRVMLPALISQLVVLLKDTSLGFVIGFSELLRTGGQLVQVLNNPLQLYLVVALIYIVINSALSALAGYVEGRQRRTTGKTPVAPTQVETGMGVL